MAGVAFGIEGICGSIRASIIIFLLLFCKFFANESNFMDL